MIRKDFLRLSVVGLKGFVISSFDSPKPENSEEIYKSAYDALIVGSGYGGAAADLRLAEKGYRVLLIEI